MASRIANLEGVEMGHTNAAGALEEMPLQREAIMRKPELMRGRYSLASLLTVIKCFNSNTQLTMFMGSAVDANRDIPLVMRFDLGKADSYLAFILAPMIEEDD